MSDAYHFDPDPKAPDPAHATDAWHSHGGPTEPPPQHAHGEIRGTVVLAWMVSLFVIIFLAILVLIFYFEQYKEREVAIRREVSLDQNAQQINTAAMAELQTIGWMDESRGVIRVPIDLAMQDTLEWYREQQ